MTDHPTPTPPPAPDWQASKGLSRTTLIVVAVAVVGFAVVAGISVLLGGASSDTVSTSAGERMCEQFIDDRIKAPATADYTHEISIVIDDDTVEVSGYVDAENAFGAKIREDYNCTVTKVDGDRWQLDDLDLG